MSDAHHFKTRLEEHEKLLEAEQRKAAEAADNAQKELVQLKVR